MSDILVCARQRVCVSGRVTVVHNTDHTRELAEVRLGGTSLAYYVAQRRSEGLSWRSIEARLKADTGIFVSRETLRTWFRDDLAEVAS